MRIPLLVGLLLSGTALAHAQTPGLGKGEAANDDPAKIWSQLSQQGIAKNQLPAGWHFDLQSPLKLPGQGWLPGRGDIAAGLGSSSIDPKSIVHPPLAALGCLPAGTPVLPNRFPGLKKMPIEMAEGKSEAMLAIPTQWPDMKLEAIPKSWPGLKLEDVLGGGPSSNGLKPK